MSVTASSEEPPAREASDVSRVLPPPLPLRLSKRKRSTEDFVTTNKIHTKKKSKNTRPIDDQGFDLENCVNTAIRNLDSHLLADYVAQRTKRFDGNLTIVELEERRIPVKAFRNTIEWPGGRTLQCLPAFIQHFSSKMGKTKNLSLASKTKGAPHTIVVTSAGLRAADITRALRTFQTRDSTVAKLFAKHIKLKDAIKHVTKTRIGIGVGTPSRLMDLMEAGALSSEKLERIVVDGSHVDQKKRGILDMKETHQPLIQLLNRPELKHRYGSDNESLDLLFF